MREIKFRAWNTDSKKMESFRYLCETIEFTDVFFGHYINLELMQYTGLKDKNGVEIYEGDIIGLDGLWSYCIDFHDGAFRKIPCNQAQKLNWPWNPLEKVTIEVHGWEVVGNIYENPELLEDNR